MSEQNETPAPTRRRSKTAIDLAFGLPNKLTTTIFNELTPTQKAALTPDAACEIFYACVECAKAVATIVDNAEKAGG